MSIITLESLLTSPTNTIKIPKIIHQTWKDATVPKKYQRPYDNCRVLHPTYEFKLWTDESSREFIKNNYNWFLKTFDGYSYPIERVDAVRYFILMHEGYGTY
jgi:mannosyltransferase OCH1-like enzyme